MALVKYKTEKLLDDKLHKHIPQSFWCSMIYTSTKRIDSVHSVLSASSSSIYTAFMSFTSLVLSLWQTVNRWVTPRKSVRLPPGPMPAPFIGNMLDFPKENSAATYASWGKQYNSDILHASSFGTHVVVLNKFEDAEELLEKRARIYSNRLFMPIIKMMGWEGNMGFMSVGPEWRKHRRIAQQHFRLDACVKQQDVQLRRLHITLRALLDTPEDFLTHIKMLSISIPLASMYGYDIKSLKDPYIAASDRSAELGGLLVMPTYTLINIFPILGRIPAWMPGAATQKMISEVKNLSNWLTNSPVDDAKKRIKENKAVPSIFTEFFESRSAKGDSDFSDDDETALARVAVAIYGGAADTMVSSTKNLIYALATHPEVQRKARAEVDRVVGMNRLPEFADRDSMPYCEAIYRELLRWRPPLNLALPHCSAEDDMYNGYFIPKGSLVTANIWEMTHNEAAYPNSDAFIPERFLTDDGQLNNDSRVLAFGFGRRICPGKHIAGSTLWLTLATLVSCFDFGKAKDKYGNEIDINHEFEDVSVTSHKKPFQCSIVPRSSATQTLLDEAVAREQLPSP